MFITSTDAALVFPLSFPGDVRFCNVAGVAGVSIVIGVEEADGAAFGFTIILGIGDGVKGDGEGSIVTTGMGEPGTAVIPGIGAIVARGEGRAASTACGAIERTTAARTFIAKPHSNERLNIFGIFYTL